MPENTILRMPASHARSGRPCHVEMFRQRQSHAFTLVELLVVIGVIAVLIALLMPALTRARQMAQRTACAARLQQIMIAANVHRTDHKDYYPLAGILTGGQPADFDDSDTQKYDYRNTSPGSGFNVPPGLNRSIAPITVALGSEMGFKSMLTDTADQSYAATLDMNGLYRFFMCPAQCVTVQEWDILEPSKPVIDLLLPSGSVTSPFPDYGAPTSYIFNEAVLGFNDHYGRLRGHASRVRQPASTLFACDGLGDTGTTPNRSAEAGFPMNYGTLTLYNNFPNAGVTLTGGSAITLADLYHSKMSGGTLVGGTASCFDPKRHQGKINIAFCDGHVEARNLTVTSPPNAGGSDLQNVFLLAP